MRGQSSDTPNAGVRLIPVRTHQSLSYGVAVIHGRAPTTSGVPHSQQPVPHDALESYTDRAVLATCAVVALVIACAAAVFIVARRIHRGT